MATSRSQQPAGSAQERLINAFTNALGTDDQFRQIHGYRDNQIAQREKRRVAAEGVAHIVRSISSGQRGSAAYQALLDDPALLDKATARMRVSGQQTAIMRNTLGRAALVGAVAGPALAAGAAAGILFGVPTAGVLALPAAVAATTVATAALAPAAAAAFTVMRDAERRHDADRNFLSMVPLGNSSRAGNSVARAIHEAVAPYVGVSNARLAALAGGRAATGIVNAASDLRDVVSPTAFRHFTIGRGLGVEKGDHGAVFNPQVFDRAMGQVLDTDRPGHLRSSPAIVARGLTSFPEHLLDGPAALRAIRANSLLGRARLPGPAPSPDSRALLSRRSSQLDSQAAGVAQARPRLAMQDRAAMPGPVLPSVTAARSRGPAH